MKKFNVALGSVEFNCQDPQNLTYEEVMDYYFMQNDMNTELIQSFCTLEEALKLFHHLKDKYRSSIISCRKVHVAILLVEEYTVEFDEDGDLDRANIDFIEVHICKF